MSRAVPQTVLIVAAIALGASVATASTVLPVSSIWRYLATPTALGPTWAAAGYDDGAWPAGPGVLGFGETYITTVVPYGPNPNLKYRTTYFRASFSVAEDPATLTFMQLSANYDDGFVAYLNGVEIARRGLPMGAFDYTTLAVSHEGGAYEPIDVTASLAQLVQGTNVLAVEVHQTSDASTDLVWDAELTVSAVPQLTRGPYLQIGSPTDIRIRWRTNVPADAIVRYGTAVDDLSQSLSSSALTTEHEMELMGLTPDTRYYYSIGTTTQPLAGGDLAHGFVTAPPSDSPKPTRIWVLGDSGQPGAGLLSVRDAYATYSLGRETDLWLMLGDNAYVTGTDAEYQAAVFDVFGDMLGRSVLWPTRGNHEFLFSGPDNDYYDIFSLPTAGEAGGVPSGSEAYYSFDHGSVHFICLDSEGSDRSLSGPMIRWLRDDLAASDPLWTIAFWHHPPYTKGSHDSDNDLDSDGRMRDMRANVLPILDSTGVDLVLTGHSHSYERSFLLNGHYGPSNTLASGMILDSGDGRVDGDGAYVKPTPRHGSFEGAVYAVAGSSSHVSGGPLNHPVMVTSINDVGSLVLDVSAARLDARFLSGTGAVLDSFTILKAAPLLDVAPREATSHGPSLSLAGQNPAGAETRLSYSLPRSGHVRLSIVDPSGRRVATLLDAAAPAGAGRAGWRGGDVRGRNAPPGVYFAVLEFAGERRAVKIVRR